MLQIEVTQAEIELLFEALEAWEEVPTREGFSSSLIGAMLAKDKESQEQTMTKTMDKSKQEELRRKRRSIMLKAKLIQSLEQESANGLFNVISTTVEPG